MPAHQPQAASVLTTAVLVVVVGLVGVAGAIRLAQSAADIGPTVGDIVDFAPNHRAARDAMPPLTVARTGLPDCAVDLAVLHQLGGSLVIEARSPVPDRSFTVRWAGRHSSFGARDCGSSAQLVLTGDDLDTLASAAGGYGIGHRRLAVSNQWHGGPVRPRH